MRQNKFLYSQGSERRDFAHSNANLYNKLNPRPEPEPECDVEFWTMKVKENHDVPLKKTVKKGTLQEIIKSETVE